MKGFLKTRYVLPAVGLLLVMLYQLALMVGGEVRPSRRNSTKDRSYFGYFLFYNVFKQLGYRVTRIYDRELPAQWGCMFFFDYYPEDKQELQRLQEWVREGNVLVLVGVHHSREPVFSRAIHYGPCKKIRTSEELSSGELRFSFTRGNHLEELDGDLVVIRSESGSLLTTGELGDGRVYIFPDTGFFANGFFRNPDHAVLLNRFLNRFYGAPVYFYEHGTTAEPGTSPVMILFKGSLAFLTLHLLLLGIVYAFRIGKRFGTPVHLAPLKRRSLSVHLAAVGLFYRKAGAYDIVEALHREYLFFRLRQLLNIRRHVTHEEIAALVVRHLEARDMPPHQVSTLLLEAGGNVSEKSILQRRKAGCRLINLLSEQRRTEKKVPSPAQASTGTNNEYKP